MNENKDVSNLPELVGPVSEWLSDSWDGGDVWGSAIGDAFAICDVLYDMGRRDLIPESLAYSPGMFGADSDDFRFIFVQEGLLYGNLTPAMLGDYLAQLDTFFDACVAAGVNY